MHAFPSSRARTVVALTALAAASLTTVALAQGPAPQPVTVRAVASFGFDDTAVQTADRERLLAEVAALKDVTWQSVTATGHTDSVGPEAYNQQLAVRRAEAVKSFLVGKGLDAGMIGTAGRGPDAPIADNASAQGRAQNRRTEVEFRGVRAGTP
jgi:OOP family OmpA-OmpF porin